MKLKSLTPKQKRVLDFITKFYEKNDFAPSLGEIAHHFRKSIPTIHQYVEVLKTKGFLQKEDRVSRGIKPQQNEVEIPLFGFIAAGEPIEAIPSPEPIKVPKNMLDRSGLHYALKVKGDSMVDEGIYDGDTVIIRRQETAENGQKVVALLNGNEATLKKIYKEKNGFRLQPANSSMKPIFVRELVLQGKVVSIIRNFEELKKRVSEKKEFTDSTLNYMAETDIKHRKLFGQYFTPRSIRETLLNQLPNNKNNPRVLDPGCGTGEFLITAKKYFKNPELHGWDIDEKLVNIARETLPEAKIKQIDALLNQDYGKYDFVIGNPPYYEFTPSKIVKKKFEGIINGRINIFSLFIYQGIKWLKKGGCLAYVVPPSMNNGAYFAKLRKFIVENSNIEYLHILDNPKIFNNALQSTMLFVLKKEKNKGNHLFKKNGILIFSEAPHYLEKAIGNKLTLHDLDYKVKTGRVVWNQNRHLLTNDPKLGIPFIWAHNIAPEKLRFPIVSEEKPQYIKTNDYDIGPAIVVNRITGSVKSAKLKAAVIPPRIKFIAENHVNVIYPPSGKEQVKMYFGDKPFEANLTLENIANQLSSKEKLEVVKNITGNTQISKTELEKLFPIDVN